MTTPSSPDTPRPAKDASADQIEADIERTRAELGHTVDALSEKLDVKSQARNKVDDVKQRATEQARTAQVHGRQIVERAKELSTDEQGTPKPAVPLAAVLAALTVVLLAVRRSRR
ncbi:DUF3618 domain-containing protein [Amycolatopsis antarctica]|uniref:DUF3618 domain-containing protein n=1 Tax=Amycolatopsis antarctica TaxID=1854586 RepID=UPI00196B8410|nr:DUF3618 domain-containing protein [Amycolatopsis antarctica]